MGRCNNSFLCRPSLLPLEYELQGKLRCCNSQKFLDLLLRQKNMTVLKLERARKMFLTLLILIVCITLATHDLNNFLLLSGFRSSDRKIGWSSVKILTGDTRFSFLVP